MVRLLLSICLLALAGCRPSTRPTRYPSEPSRQYASPPPQQYSNVPPPHANAVAPGEARFSGRITEIHFGCAVDASCNLVVDGTKHVHFGHDTRGEPASEWGDADSLWPLMQTPGSGVGRTVEVYAASDSPESFTIQGKRAYYIRVLGP